MTQVEIVEGNKLIAEFMGMKFGKYHTLWDWLMPVVDKINNTKVGDKWFRVVIAPTQCMILVYAHGGMSVPMKEPEFHVGAKEKMIEAVWQAVIQFLQWYNQNK